MLIEMETAVVSITCSGIELQFRLVDIKDNFMFNVLKNYLMLYNRQMH